MVLLDGRPRVLRKKGHALVGVNQNSGVDLTG